MSKIFYTSDLHLGNKNIISYENRPWKTVEEMDNALIYNWNQVVGEEDEVYVLGDFCFKGASKATMYLSSLNGYIHLLRGNHDHFMTQQSFREFVDIAESDYYMARGRVAQLSPLIVPEGWYKHMQDGEHEVVLCHFPMLYWDRMEQGSVHLYGHAHNYRDCSAMASNSFNVGVDANDYRPVTLEQLLAKQNKV